MSEVARQGSAKGVPSLWVSGARSYEAVVGHAHLKQDRIALAALWSAHDRWVHRRVEQISLSEAGRMKRSVSLHVELPWALLDRTCGVQAQSAPVPIVATSRTAELELISACDGSGRALPVRTLEESELVALGALRLLLEGGGILESEAVQGTLVKLLAGRTDEPFDIQFGDAHAALSLATALRKRQLLIVDVSRSEGEFEVLKVAWEERIAQMRKGLLWPTKVAVGIETSALGGGSHHIEVEPPTDFDVAMQASASAVAREADQVHVEGQGLVERPLPEDRLLLTLKPKRGTLLSMLAPALAVAGFSVALLATSTLSASQSAISAILLLLPAAGAFFTRRSGSIDAWTGWGLSSALVGFAAFVGAASVALGVAGEAQDAILAGAVAIAGFVAVATTASVGWVALRAPSLESHRALVSYVGESTRPVWPSEDEITEAVERLIASAYEDEHESLQAEAAQMAEAQSYVASERPELPRLSGELVDDVLRLTELEPTVIAQMLSVDGEWVQAGVHDRDLPRSDRSKLEAVRAAALVLYGSLGARGLGEWFTAGPSAPLEEIARGDLDLVRKRLDRYLSSPAG